MCQRIILIFAIICLLIVTVKTTHDGTVMDNTETTSPSIADAVLLDGRNQTDVDAVINILEANNGDEDQLEEVQMETDSEQDDEIEIIEEVAVDEPESPLVQ